MPCSLPYPRFPVVARLVSKAADVVLEGSVVGSFTRIGPEVRSRLAGWQTPPRADGAVVLVTGATSGLGLSTAIGLARLGATVRFVGRSEERAKRARASMLEAVPGSDVDYLLADLSDLDQVRRMAGRFLDVHDRLDVLIHNAGTLSRSYGLAPSGLETTVSAQLVAPFLLTGLLLPALRAPRSSRVIWVSSGGMYTQRFELSAVEMGPDEYDGTVAYARVKRAQLVGMHEWARRLGPPGVVVHAMHPGWADTPGVVAGLPTFAKVMRPWLRRPDQGADTTVWLSTASEALATTHRFWLDRQRRLEHKVPWTRLPAAQFDRAGSELWDWCAERCGWDGLSRPDHGDGRA